MSTPAPARTVLIVEPDATTAQLYRRELGRHFQVLTCSTARDAAEVITAEPLSAIVLEPSGAASTADAVVASLKDAVAVSATPLIICSVLDDRSVGQALGASLYLVKPVLPASLFAALTNLILDEYVSGT